MSIIAPPRIARIDCGVGLDEVLVVLDAETAAACGADDAHRGGFADAERIADRENQIAHLQLGGIAERQRGQILRVNFQDRDVGLRDPRRPAWPAYSRLSFKYTLMSVAPSIT